MKNVLDFINDLEGLYDAVYHLSENKGNEWKDDMLRMLKCYENMGNSPIKESLLQRLNERLEEAICEEYGIASS